MPQREKATFTIVESDSGPPQGDSISVDFNPTSLQYVVNNTLQNTGRGTNTKQYVGQSTAKLTMDLIFDTTDTGQNVRAKTGKIAKLMEPTRAISSNASDRDRKIPPLVHFQWGSFVFKGMIDSFKETIDFFSETGVPLRASINLSMSKHDHIFDQANPEGNRAEPVSLNLDEIVVPPSRNQSATSAATQGGDPRAARSIAAANNLESMRFTDGAPLTVNPSAPMKAASPFAAAGPSLGAGISQNFGGASSAGVSVSAGAFQGLRGGAGTAGAAGIDPTRFLRTSDSAGIATDAGAGFSVGGKAMLEGSSALNADVGTKTDLRARIQFDQR